MRASFIIIVVICLILSVQITICLTRQFYVDVSNILSRQQKSLVEFHIRLFLKLMFMDP